MFERLPSFFIKKYSDKEYGKENFYIDKKNIDKEGRKIVIEYWHNEWERNDFEFPTRLQILRNYSNAIVKAGGGILFERYNQEFGHYSFKIGDKQIWVEIRASSSGKNYTLTIIEESIMRQDIVIDADLIKNKLDIEGRIAIYGIYFDTGKAIVKEESKPALEQIAKYLKDNPSVKCWVVGHTDADGSFEVNSKLSLDRAKAIKTALENDYAIDGMRLFAEGVGPLAPVATNTTEEGKKLNRRVELVKK